MGSAIGCILEISRGLNGADFEWRVKAFEPKDFEKEGVLESPLFSFGGSKWFLMFGRKNGSSPILLGLRRCALKPPVRLWLGLRRADGGRQMIGSGRMGADWSEVSYPWLSFSELEKRLQSLSSSGTLTFLIRIRTGPETDNEMRSLKAMKEPSVRLEEGVDGFAVVDLRGNEMRRLKREQASSLGTSMENSTQTDQEDTRILLEQYRKYLLHAADHDVLLRVKGRDFKAHKSVLRARSSVFEVMFRQETKNTTDAIIVDDCDADCFGDFLMYVYTGEVENLSATKAIGLYFASDKYDFPSLKSRCVDVLKASLTTSLVCDVIALSVAHRENELLESTMLYVTEHLEEVMESTKWKQFTLSNPIQANEISLKAIKRRLNSNPD